MRYRILCGGLMASLAAFTGCASEDTASADAGATGGNVGGSGGGAGGDVTGGTTGGSDGGTLDASVGGSADVSTLPPDGPPADMPVPDAGVPGICEPVPPACVDQMIQELSLHDDKVSDGEVSTARDSEDFVTTVDATAGGYGQSSNNPWVYVRFGAEGAERVDIDDETALESQDWDLAARRFILRLNGGDSGPSCVGAVSFLERSYADLDTVPESLEYLTDDYYTDACQIVNDSSGLPGSPQVVLAPWWEYAGCVGTTGVPHLIRLADGRVIKMVVDAYYEDPADQEACNATGAAPDGAVSAVFTLRWRPMP